MKKKSVVATLLTASILIAACGKKEPEVDWQAQYNAMKANYDKAWEDADNLRRILANYDEKYMEDINLNQYTILDTGGLSFNSFDDKVWLNSQIGFQATDVVANDSKLNILSNMSIQPSDRWTMRVNTSDTEFSHPNGIVGQFRVYKVYNSTSQAFIKSQYIDPFLEANSLTSVSDRVIFQGSGGIGTEVTTRLKISDSAFGTEHRMIRNDAIYTADELAEMQSVADAAVQASEAARVAQLESEYYESMAAESTEAQTDDAGETIPPPAFVPPATSAAAPDVASGEVDVILPKVSTEMSDYMFRVGVIIFGETGVIYQFVYKDDENSRNNSEILDSLITSMKVDSMPIKLE